MRILLLLMFCLTLGTVQAQKKKKQDVEAIKAMCGCYDVSFNFAETFATDKDYEFHDNYRSGALEYVFPVEESKDKIVLQHLLVIGDSMIIKHWRQDWLYENTDLHVFHKDNTWKYKSKAQDAVKGQWTQKVYQVDDGPRYQGSSSWVHVDGKSYWENTADAPLPRREFSKRSDYNVMVRRNRQEITDYGWVHEQDNDKVLRESSDKVLAHEKGWNTYTKTDEKKCQLAKDWWQEKQAYWNDVRKVWDELFATKKTLEFEKKIDGKVLFMKLFALEKEMLKGNYDSAASITKIKATINPYLKGEVALVIN
ncbi:hypothetical protein QQ020_13840 [Fulvivirgaceae bacterium BMA12]|uniref:Uncharacterized protein n=1 Tax=Agaribacillus aureus TaxID=3051825 RepID=A0ABT8L5X3_9BACT|nr:hypothetical protein [Fulvivirgaceae bacterium BMA12]